MPARTETLPAPGRAREVPDPVNPCGDRCGGGGRYDSLVKTTKMTMFRSLLAAGLALPLLSAAAGPTSALASGPRVQAPVAKAIEALPVAAESRAGYQRSKFRHWIDVDHDGCNTRAEVLIEEAVVPPSVSAGCRRCASRAFAPPPARRPPWARRPLSAGRRGRPVWRTGTRTRARTWAPGRARLRRPAADAAPDVDVAAGAVC